MHCPQKSLCKWLLFSLLSCLTPSIYAQITLTGHVSTAGAPLEFATVALEGTSVGAVTDSVGYFELAGLEPGHYRLQVTYLGYTPHRQEVRLDAGPQSSLKVELAPAVALMDAVVVTGTLREVSRLESPVPVEVYRPSFFKKNPTPNVFEALQNVNGVRPQLNCNVCNTGDIHINGLEGPYTMVLVDGMPIVSSLATVYGLSGIPNSLIERVEIVKGPASSLYGSEAIGGLINIITKAPARAPLLSIDVMATSWQEYHADLGLRLRLGERGSVLTGVNYFNFDDLVDHNGDHFTDVTLQERISIFQKWQFNRPQGRLFTLAGRYYYEDRWGGELHWNRSFRGSDEVYGESIATTRWELIGQYQLPSPEKLLLAFSFNSHQQNSVYGDLPYLADQQTGFGQLTWDKTAGPHTLLTGLALRYTYYDDNTPATGGEAGSPGNRPDHTWLPGIFVQDEWQLGERHDLLLGLRYDHNSRHGHILTPRIAYKWALSPTNLFRLNAGTGFRIVNLFTEEHAALTGAREVVIAESLRPERSFNVNLNYTRKHYLPHGGLASFELSAWYTYFTNLILPDYETNTNQIIYDNLSGHAITQGLSANADLSLANGISLTLGATFMDVASVEQGIRHRQLLTERFSGSWALSYAFRGEHLSIDYTGSIYGPMRLPLLSELDPRAPESPTYSLQNIQLTYRFAPGLECYAGIKNLLNWTPWRGQSAPIIARSFDPFDRGVVFDENGVAVATPDNPHALTFDPSYVYGPNQGRRAFVGLRYKLD
ncbi:MAG: TonB-dependent receptor [Lewinella sp.]|nr:TonB-dependent receptor [Lewinella sp.]